MGLFIFIVVIIVAVCIYAMVSSNERDKMRVEAIERRKKYVESISPGAKIIVNNGIHLFFKNDEQRVFGMDETGKTYGFDGLHNVSVYRDGISFFHTDSLSLCVGKNYSRQETTVSLDYASVAAIAAEMMPVLRQNLYKELSQEGVVPTHEYEHRGEIWGCDLNSRKFFCTAGCFQIHDFADLRRVTIEDLTNNTLYDGSYIIHVVVKNDYGWDDTDYEIHFHSQDSTFHNLLAMFKGIRNRQ